MIEVTFVWFPLSFTFKINHKSKLTVSQSSESYSGNALEISILNAAESSFGPDDLITLFYMVCSCILDSDFRNKISEYWLDDYTHFLRQACCEAEH